MTKSRKTFITILSTILIMLLALLFLFPLVWMIASSMKTESAIYNDLGGIKAFLPGLNPAHWGSAYQKLLGRFNIVRFILNSVFYALAVTFGSVLVNSAAGYAFSKFDFRGKKFLFGLLIASMVVPGDTIMIQKFQIIKTLHLINSPWAVIFPAVAGAFNIYMFKNFFDQVSDSIVESAELDGANVFTIYWRVLLPMAKPVIATVGTLSFIGSWNDYIWPLMVLTDADKFPLQVAITNINNTQPVYMNQVMAILTISTVPLILIYMFFQKYLVQGLAVAGNGDK
ncbi:carbohydrate ABC transporter permease [Lapidilactobacillus dextrinicus]|uniref:carbohydrate ABC transporter permease n=1 Tax=Lapidilactobacillus dextrinicus TaxID=51664 RepID=UPI0022DF9691|nr:carbohydrate ABC transporter permease [Lapidilactobacillus dextrinicus]